MRINYNPLLQLDEEKKNFPKLKFVIPKSYIRNLYPYLIFHNHIYLHLFFNSFSFLIF